MNKTPKIYVAGHRGMVGSAIIRKLHAYGFNNIVVRTHAELDLTNQEAVDAFFKEERPDQVYLAAAKVGGIHANDTYPAEFIYQNMMIEANVIHAAWKHDVQKLLFLGSSCIYPKLAEQPMREDALLTATLEPTNEPYAIAKIAGIKLCESYNRQYGVDYRSVMPTSLYGPGDNYHPENSHVIPALIRRFHEAKVLNNPEDEFIHSKALVHKGNSAKVIGRKWKWSEFRHFMKVVHCGAFHKSILFDDLGGFDSSYKIAGDYEFLLRKGNALKARYIDEVAVEMAPFGVSQNQVRVFFESARAKIANRAVSWWRAFFDMLYALLVYIITKIS